MRRILINELWLFEMLNVPRVIIAYSKQDEVVNEEDLVLGDKASFKSLQT